VSLEFLIFALIFAGWLGALRLLQQKRNLARIFGVLMMSVWLYVSLLLLVFTFAPPLEIWLLLGAAPVFVIAYGYRLYEHYGQRNKRKNDHKIQQSA
jgi:predicted lysophospholipase L1 biosynthesis ABC-type transport system permease subunit